MKKKLGIFLGVTLALTSIAGFVGYREGIKKGVKIESFYGKVMKVEENKLYVKGIQENDINHRGEFILKISKATDIQNILKEKMKLQDLKEDDEISVFYGGEILETYPIEISKVYKVILIE